MAKPKNQASRSPRKDNYYYVLRDDKGRLTKLDGRKNISVWVYHGNRFVGGIRFMRGTATEQKIKNAVAKIIKEDKIDYIRENLQRYIETWNRKIRNLKLQKKKETGITYLVHVNLDVFGKSGKKTRVEFSVRVQNKKDGKVERVREKPRNTRGPKKSQA